jgi:glucosamine-6-phosphate deaminase
MKIFKRDVLEVRVYDDRVSMGAAAAEMVGERICQLTERQETVNIIFAAAPSQDEFLAALGQQDIEWPRVNAFHMDEYIGLDREAPQGFGNFLEKKLFSRVALRAVHYLDGNAADIGAECRRYSGLLKAQPADIVALGIGENTHLAFNDPHVAQFNDPVLVKFVDLDEDCRRQQVNDGCFRSIGEVPTHAITLTIPALLQAGSLFAIVPGKRKAEAVWHTLYGEVSERYPSTILRQHPNARLYLDAESAGKIDQKKLPI